MPGITRADEHLMQDVVRGQHDCLEPLMRRYASPLLTFIKRMVGDHQKSEDLFQEVFLAVWDKRRQYEYPRPFKPWLYKIALNKCRASFRRKYRPIAMEPELFDTVGGSNLGGGRGEAMPLDTAVAEEVATYVQDAVMALPDKQRTVVVLRVWNGLSYAEIAEIMGSREATVRSNMHHALRTMRGALASRVD
ncbi:MAG: sigma-70 family RNA polymerase sigma factor [Phycisphaera sp.]|nr:sigma-70 family RNA polymerase sigma factor [Phycisphaera sp.]